MGCASSKGSSGKYILDNEKEGIHILDGDETGFLNDFLEEKLLGEGEFGEVKLVTATSGHLKGKQFASKSIKKGYTFKNNSLLSPVKPEYIRRECLILRELAGKRHTMDLIALYEGPSVVYMITELLSGGEMGDWLVNKETKELRTEDVSRIACQVLDAIDYCHSKGVIHRDLKPENIMFTDKSDNAPLKVIDWGSSSFDASIPDYKHHTFAGSAFYVSPEMFLQMTKTDKTSPYSSKTDIWSVGVLLYVLVAGYPADKLQKAFNVIQKPPSQNRDLTLLPNLPDDLPDEFMDLLEKCMNYRHKSRPCAEELLNHAFVKFHEIADLKTDVSDVEVKDQDGLDLAHVLIVANGGDSITATAAKQSTRKGMRSRALRGSIARHSMYLDFTKYERALTSLLATVLSEEEYEGLINKLENIDGEHESNLKVIQVKDLKKILETDFTSNTTILSAMDKLKGAFIYEDYAYHISKLRLFSTQKKAFNMDDSNVSTSSSIHKISSSDHKGQKHGANLVRNHSVYGSNVYSSWAKEKSAGLKKPTSRGLGSKRASVQF